MCRIEFGTSSSTGFAVRKSNFTLGKCKISKYKFANIFLTYINIPNICHKFTSLKSRIALQVARKIAPCEWAFNYKWYYNSFN